MNGVGVVSTLLGVILLIGVVAFIAAELIDEREDKAAREFSRSKLALEADQFVAGMQTPSESVKHYRPIHPYDWEAEERADVMEAVQPGPNLRLLKQEEPV